MEEEAEEQRFHNYREGHSWGRGGRLSCTCTAGSRVLREPPGLVGRRQGHLPLVSPCVEALAPTQARRAEGVGGSRGELAGGDEREAPEMIPCSQREFFPKGFHLR